MGKFHTLLWDVDNTVLDFDRSEYDALSRCFEKFGLELQEETAALYSEINLSFWKRLELGQIGRQELLTGRFREFFRRLSITDVDADQFQREYQDNLGSVYYYKERSNELLKELSGQYRQYFVTNGVAATQRNKLRLSGLDRLVNGIFISEELGAEKPDRLFFERSFAQIPDFDKEGALLIGDSLSSDMKGAFQAGIASCWYHPGWTNEEPSVPLTYEIHSLWEVKKILESAPEGGEKE